MTKEETLKILAMLSAFYGQGKSNPSNMATAWHLILGKYEYRIAQKAILTFAENDTREYATFPAVGKIVEAIKFEEKKEYAPINAIVRGIAYGRHYSNLPDEAKALISSEKYDAWLSMNAEEFASQSDALAESLKATQIKMLEGSA